jgi:hypothetical protein
MSVGPANPPLSAIAPFQPEEGAARPGGKRYGIAIVGNDKIIDWLLPFLESYRATNAHLPIYLIPYDENVTLTRRAADAYGAHFVEETPDEIDRLALELYPGFFNSHRRRLRKLHALALPLDEVAYVDVDVVLFRDLAPIFGKLEAGKTEFIVASPSLDYVYNEKRANYAFLRDAFLFNDGFWITSNTYLTLAHFIDTIREDAEIFHEVRKRGQLFAQPLVNFVTHRRGLAISTLPDCVEKASAESFYRAKGITFEDGKPLDPWGAEIYFAHWAGATMLPSTRAFDAAWKDYSRLAWERFRK